MKLAGAAVLALGTLTATVDTADAAGGCGPGFHRNYYGFCRPNVFYRPYVVRPAYYGYGYGWHRPWGWRRHWGWHHHWAWHRRWGWHRHWG
jgi:hypothetical protein